MDGRVYIWMFQLGNPTYTVPWYNIIYIYIYVKIYVHTYPKKGT